MHDGLFYCPLHTMLFYSGTLCAVSITGMNRRSLRGGEESRRSELEKRKNTEKKIH